MQGNKNNTLYNLFSLLSKPLQKVIGVSIAICGINIFGVISAFGILGSQSEFFEKYYELIVGAIIVMTFLIIIGFWVISIALCIALLRISPFIENFNKNLISCTENCTNIQSKIEQEQEYFNEFEKENKGIEGCVEVLSQQLNRFESVVTELEIAGNIINKRKLMEIEKNVSQGTDIIIFSSKYKLDEEFKPIIINNIKKGVTYKYIVSGADSSSPSHMRFMQIVESWYCEYKKSFHKEIKGTAIKDKKRTKAGQIFANKYPTTDYENDFYDHIKEYCSPFAYDTLTIMLYRKAQGNTNYHVIVNLPSEKDGYYSYILPENNAETNKIIDAIIAMCKKDRQCNYRGEKNER
mgnify:CR=1 FL=1